MFEDKFCREIEDGIVFRAERIFNKLETIDILFSLYKNIFGIRFVLLQKVDESKRSRVSEFLTRLNLKLDRGLFVMNPIDGEIEFRIDQNFYSEVSQQIFEEIFRDGFVTLNRYGDEILNQIEN